jgi:hypothetical protein
MRPKIVLTLLVVVELFLIVLLCSPALWRSKRRLLAEGAWLQNRTSEAARALHNEHKREQGIQHIVCTLAVLGAITIIMYGAWHQTQSRSAETRPPLRRHTRTPLAICGLAAVAALGLWQLFTGDTLIRQRRNMTKAEEHAPVVREKLNSTPEFQHLRVSRFTGGGGSLLVDGTLADEADVKRVSRSSRIRSRRWQYSINSP